MPETEVGPLKATVVMDLGKDWNPGIAKMQQDVKTSKVKGKEMDSVFGGLGDTLESLTKIGATFGAGLLATMLGILGTSPQFKEFLAKMKVPFLELALFLGDIFGPALDAVFMLFSKFVDFVTTNETIGTGLRFLNDIFVDIATSLDDLITKVDSGGWKGFVSWLSDLPAGSPFPVLKIMATAFENVGWAIDALKIKWEDFKTSQMLPGIDIQRDAQGNIIGIQGVTAITPTTSPGGRIPEQQGPSTTTINVFVHDEFGRRIGEARANTSGA